MEIIKCNKLSGLQRNDIEKLNKIVIEESQCEIFTYTDEGENMYPKFNTFYLYYEGSDLLGYISVFQPDGYVINAYPIVHPSYRRRGIFRKLYTQLLDEFEYFKFETCAFAVSFDNEVAKAVLPKIMAYKNSTEYVMKYELGVMESADTGKKFLLECDAPNGDEYVYVFYDYVFGKFKRSLGSLQIFKDDRTACLSAFEITSSKRGKGYGRRMLTEVARDLYDKGFTSILLQVSSLNQVAFHLYDSFGFKEVSKLDSWFVDREKNNGYPV